MNPMKKIVRGKAETKRVASRGRKTRVRVCTSTAGQWNTGRELMQMTHDSFMWFLLDLYDTSKGIIPRKKSLREGRTSLNIAGLMMAATSFAEKHGIMKSSNEKYGRKHHYDDQVLYLPSSPLDMTSLVVAGSKHRYLLHSGNSCTWEPEEIFSHFHQDIVSKYASTWNITKEDDIDGGNGITAAHHMISDIIQVEEDGVSDLIQTVHNVISDMVDMVEIVIQLEEEEEEENNKDDIYNDRDDDWDPHIGRRKDQGNNDESNGDGDYDDDDDDDDDDDFEEWSSDQDSDIFKRPALCDICGKSVTGLHRLNKHKQSCVKGPINCGVCGRTFEDRRQLQQHNRVHKQKTYNCQYCDKSFSFENHLVRHVRTHTNDRPFKCDYCEKKFAQKIQLKCHLRVHTNEKPYECKKCDAAFAHNVSLVNHTRKHHSQ